MTVYAVRVNGKIKGWFFTKEQAKLTAAHYIRICKSVEILSGELHKNGDDEWIEVTGVDEIIK